MPAISHLFFTHAARAWGSSPELETQGDLLIWAKFSIISK